jgi:hypothetical protein
VGGGASLAFEDIAAQNVRSTKAHAVRINSAFNLAAPHAEVCGT